MNLRLISIQTACLLATTGVASAGGFNINTAIKAIEEKTPVINTINGKVVNRPVIQTETGPKVALSGASATPVKVEDKDNLLAKLPEIAKSYDTVIGPDGKTLRVVDEKLRLVGDWKAALDSKIAKKDQGLVSDITQAIEVLDEKSKTALRNGDYTGAGDIVQQYGVCQEEIIKTYRSLIDGGNHGLRNTLAANYAKSKAGQKAWYGRDDNFRPYVYEMIYQRSRSCVGIEPHGSHNHPKGSGVLVGPNLVLTAWHVVEDAAEARDFDVIFDYEESLDPAQDEIKSLPVIRRRVTGFVFVGTAPDNDSSPLDFVLLEIEPAHVGQERTPIGLCTDRIRPETPIVLVGHPRQSPRMIHDNSWIRFPYQVSDFEFTQLLATVNAELKENGSEDGAAEADNFVRFYRPFTSPDGLKSYFYVNQRSGKANHVMGAECDTFKGDSGAPAMLRESGRVVGILIEGEPDQDIIAGEQTRLKANAYKAGWVHHERILPIVKVVEQLDKLRPGWQEKYHVKIDKD